MTLQERAIEVAAMLAPPTEAEVARLRHLLMPVVRRNTIGTVMDRAA